ncbi:hypothetical protein MX763_003604 [Salmonella enterica subsp. enterica serovar Montevideo]|nr:hypothetical protein [Salmonella enterica subsp. enterica serovar Derby]EJC1546076.1 hypothetical protein [Salmonella enterica subsp. enterica serovar Montevideo]HAK3958916.1 hypothetical protein [Salmonella enterica]HAK8959652.1 hypothetical protein [Salmonella enterica]
MTVYDCRQTRIGLSAIWTSLLALGHEKLWLRDDGAFVQIVTWDGFIAAELDFNLPGWIIGPEAIFIYNNPAGYAPDDAQELTDECVARLTAAYS